MRNYQHIVSTLGVTTQFLEAHWQTIFDRLQSASNSMTHQTKESKDCFSQQAIFGINQCIHLASSIVLLGTEKDKLATLIDSIRQESYTNDPTTILTVSTLYYLLADYILEEKIDDTSADTFKVICTRFSEVNWMVGESDMGKLDIKSQ